MQIVFSQKGGTPFYESALQVVNLAQTSSGKGWKPSDGTRNRFWLIDAFAIQYVPRI